MTDTPLRCLKFLSGIRDERPGRDRISRALGVTPRTVDRGLRVLVLAGAIVRQRGGRATAPMFTVIMTVEEFLSHQMKMSHQTPFLSHQVVENVPPSGVLNLKVVIQERKTVVRELTQHRTPPDWERLEREFGEAAERWYASGAGA